MQKLKDDIRQAIIDSASDLFASKGTEKSNMREVAKGANITAGNLYRYFPNKDALVLAITGPALSEIDSLLQTASNNTLSLNGVGQNVDFALLKDNIHKLAEGLADIYYRHSIAMIIISNDAKTVKKLENWLSEIFYLFFQDSLSSQADIKLISRMYSVSVIAAVKEAFKSKPQNSEILNQTVSYYLTMVLKGVNI